MKERILVVEEQENLGGVAHPSLSLRGDEVNSAMAAGGKSRHRNNFGRYGWYKRCESVDFMPGFDPQAEVHFINMAPRRRTHRTKLLSQFVAPRKRRMRRRSCMGLLVD